MSNHNVDYRRHCVNAAVIYLTLAGLTLVIAALLRITQLAWGAGKPTVKPLPTKVVRADLAGHQWHMIYGDSPCVINLWDDGSYEHNINGGTWDFYGTWEVIDGELILTETTDSETWHQYRCRLTPQKNWHNKKLRGSGGEMSRYPLSCGAGAEKPLPFSLSAPGPLPALKPRVSTHGY